MSDFSHLLTDPSIAEAIHAHVGAKPGHRVVGLHDGVLVRDEIIERRSILAVPFGAPLPSDVVRSYSEPYATVEVVLSSPTGRVYAERHRGSLAEFLILAGVATEARAS